MAVELATGDVEVAEEAAGLLWQLRLFGRTEPIDIRESGDLARVAAAVLLRHRTGGDLVHRGPIYVLHAAEPADPDIARAERAILLDLATGGPITVPQRNQRSRELRLTSETLAVALDRLTADRLIRLDSDGTITAQYPAEAPKIRHWPADLSARWINPRPGSDVKVGRVDRTALRPVGLPLALPLADVEDASAGVGGGICGPAANGPVGESNADLRGRPVAHPLDRRPPDPGRAEEPSTDEPPGGPITPSTDADGPDRPAAGGVLHRTVRAVLAALLDADGPLPRSTIRNHRLSGPQKRRLGEALDLLIAAGVVSSNQQTRATVYLIHYRWQPRIAELDLDVLAAEVISTARN